MTPAKAQKALDQLWQRYDSDVQAILDSVRDQVILPFCRRRRLTFSAGMGSWSFHALDGRMVFWSDRPPPKAVAAAVLLEIEGMNNDGGSLMADVTKEDLA